MSIIWLIQEQCEYYCVSAIFSYAVVLLILLIYMQPKSLIDVGECIIERVNPWNWIKYSSYVEIVFLDNFVIVRAEAISDNTDNKC